MVNGLPQFHPPLNYAKIVCACDICGLINPISNNKKRYLLTFTDDFSRKTWVYFLVEKSEAFAVFKSFKTYVEKETRSFLRCLRTDREGEFTSQEFAIFCDVHGIRRQTIMNMVRSMLSAKKLPKTFWPKVVNWTVHVLNRSPTFAVQNKTPEEAWVSEESKAYRLYDPISQKIIISRDVVFEEDKNWDWDKKYEEAIVCDLEWGDDGEEATVNEEESDSNLDADIEEDTEENNATATAAESDAAVTTSDLLIQNRDNPSNSNAARNRRPPVWTSDYETGEGLSEEEHEVQLAMFAAADPIYFEEVKSEKWRNTMDVEMEAIKKNGKWVLTNLPKEEKQLDTKLDLWRRVTQRFGVDYTEVFAPMAHMETIRLVVALAAQRGWSIYR
ncbi:hypothetical protein AAG906_035385 [Vitis piasezkii]